MGYLWLDEALDRANADGVQLEWGKTDGKYWIAVKGQPAKTATALDAAAFQLVQDRWPPVEA